MQETIRVRVDRPKSLGKSLAREIDFEVQAQVIKDIQSNTPNWQDPKKIATAIANSLSMQELRKKILAEEAKPKAYSKPVVVEEKIFLSLPQRMREPLHVELRVVRQGVIEVHPGQIGHA